MEILPKQLGGLDGAHFDPHSSVPFKFKDRHNFLYLLRTPHDRMESKLKQV